MSEKGSFRKIVDRFVRVGSIASLFLPIRGSLEGNPNAHHHIEPKNAQTAPSIEPALSNESPAFVIPEEVENSRPSTETSPEVVTQSERLDLQQGADIFEFFSQATHEKVDLTEEQKTNVIAALKNIEARVRHNTANDPFKEECIFAVKTSAAGEQVLYVAVNKADDTYDGTVTGKKAKYILYTDRFITPGSEDTYQEDNYGDSQIFDSTTPDLLQTIFSLDGAAGREDWEKLAEVAADDPSGYGKVGTFDADGNAYPFRSLFDTVNIEYSQQ